MNFIKLIPIYLSSLALSAHFLRGWNIIFAFLCLIIPFLLLIPRKWVVRVIQIFLVLGACEWIITMFFFGWAASGNGTRLDAVSFDFRQCCRFYILVGFCLSGGIFEAEI